MGFGIKKKRYFLDYSPLKSALERAAYLQIELPKSNFVRIPYPLLNKALFDMNNQSTHFKKKKETYWTAVETKQYCALCKREYANNLKTVD